MTLRMHLNNSVDRAWQSCLSLISRKEYKEWRKFAGKKKARSPAKEMAPGGLKLVWYGQRLVYSQDRDVNARVVEKDHCQGRPGLSYASLHRIIR